MNNNSQWLLIEPNTCLQVSKLLEITLTRKNEDTGVIAFIGDVDSWEIGDYPWNIIQKIYNGILYRLNDCSGVIDVVGLVKSCMESEDET